MLVILMVHTHFVFGYIITIVIIIIMLVMLQC